MPFGLKVLWSIFIAAVVAMAISNWRDGNSDGGGACAYLGFGILFVLIMGTLLERRELRARRREQEGDDHVP